MVLKLIGCVLLVLCTTACGFMLAGRLAKRQKFLADFVTFISLLSTELRYGGEDIFILVKRCGTNAGLPNMNCFEKAGEGSAFADVWQTWTDKTVRTLHLLRTDCELLRDFGAPLGATDLDGQLEHLALYSSRFKALLETARLDGTKKAKLYKTLGFFAGCCAAAVIV